MFTSTSPMTHLNLNKLDFELQMKFIYLKLKIIETNGENFSRKT